MMKTKLNHPAVDQSWLAHLQNEGLTILTLFTNNT